MPAAYVIRAERRSDHAQIREVVAAAFGSQAEADLVERIRASAEYVSEMALVAESAGAVIGHVMISGALIRHAGGERRIVMLSPLAVAPEHQGGGIGGALVRASTVIADQRGEPMVVLEGSPEYYPRLGFEPAEPHGIVLPLPQWAPSEAAQVMFLASHRAGDPTLRGTVVYPPAFDGIE